MVKHGHEIGAKNRFRYLEVMNSLVDSASTNPRGLSLLKTQKPYSLGNPMLSLLS